MIRVEKDAQRTDAYQKNDNLVLSDSARADSIPGLEIEANDVRCTHGATAGRVDEDMIFYAQARGISRETAVRLIVGASSPTSTTGSPWNPSGRRSARPSPPSWNQAAKTPPQDQAPHSTDRRVHQRSTAMGAPYAHPEVLVSADWVEEHLNDPKVRIVESDEDVLLYDMGHIPGAVKIDWQGDLQDQIVRDYIDAEKFAEICSPQRHRQRHDRRLLRRQVELVGLLRLLGVQAVRPQGLPGHERRPEALARPEAARHHRGPSLPGHDATRSQASNEAQIRVFRDEVLAHIKAGKPLLDVRSPKEFTGEKLHMEDYPQEGALRGGHIPGAKNVPWARAVNEDGTFKSAEELKAIYEGEVGLKPTDDVVAYCRIGERSSLTWFVLTYLLGYPKVRNYDGSWTEWGNLVRVPDRQGGLSGGAEDGSSGPSLGSTAHPPLASIPSGPRTARTCRPHSTRSSPS